jgi:hypothetical protein
MLPALQRKKAVSTILGGMGSSKEDSAAHEAAEGEAPDQYHAVAGDIINAIRSGSPPKLAMALKTFHSLKNVSDSEE